MAVHYNNAAGVERIRAFEAKYTPEIIIYHTAKSVTWRVVISLRHQYSDSDEKQNDLTTLSLTYSSANFPIREPGLA